MRQIISEGQASNRQEIFINIDNFYPSSGSRFYNGTAILVGDLKLLMAVRNHRWHKPLELFPRKKTKKVTVSGFYRRIELLMSFTFERQSLRATVAEW